MRRQEKLNNTEAISYRIEGAARVDPHSLTRHFHARDLREKAAKLTAHSTDHLFGEKNAGHVQIKADHVLVECHLKSDLPLIVRVPLSYYRGVGARFVVSQEEGNPVICILELVHDDPLLTVPVLVTADLEDAAIDWQSWSRRFDLMMLHWPMGAEDYCPVANSKGANGVNSNGMGKLALSVREQAPRRHHAQFASRRPRFLVRRKTGKTGQMPSLTGREIIART